MPCQRQSLPSFLPVSSCDEEIESKREGDKMHGGESCQLAATFSGCRVFPLHFSVATISMRESLRKFCHLYAYCITNTYPSRSRASRERQSHVIYKSWSRNTGTKTDDSVGLKPRSMHRSVNYFFYIFPEMRPMEK